MFIDHAQKRKAENIPDFYSLHGVLIKMTYPTATYGFAHDFGWVLIIYIESSTIHIYN